MESRVGVFWAEETNCSRSGARVCYVLQLGEIGGKVAGVQIAYGLAEHCKDLTLSEREAIAGFWAVYFYSF